MQKLIALLILLSILAVGYVDGQTQQLEASVYPKTSHDETNSNLTQQPFSFVKDNQGAETISQSKTNRLFRQRKPTNSSQDFLNRTKQNKKKYQRSPDYRKGSEPTPTLTISIREHS